MKSLSLLLLALTAFSAVAHDYGYGHNRSRRHTLSWRNRHFHFFVYRPLRFNVATEMTDYTPQCINNWNSDSSTITGLHNRINLHYNGMGNNPERALAEFRKMAQNSYSPKFKPWCVSGGWVDIDQDQVDYLYADFNLIGNIARCGKLIAEYHIYLNKYNNVIESRESTNSDVDLALLQLKIAVGAVVKSNDCQKDPNLILDGFIREKISLDSL